MPKNKLTVRGFVVSNGKKYVIVGTPIIGESGIIDFKDSKLVPLSEYTAPNLYEYLYNENEPAKTRRLTNPRYSMPYIGFEQY